MNTLFVIATPIGNMEDITIRAIKILLTAKIVVCEDTRHTGQLLKTLEERYGANVLTPVGFSRKLVSVRDWNEAESIDKVLMELKNSDVALVSDAGTPLLSDPGFKIVRAARAAGFAVVPIPGAFAGAAAMAAAGLPTNKIMFWGFLPKKWELDPEMTHVIYEAPNRTVARVTELRSKYPTAQIVIANELTKIHERIEEMEKWEKLEEIKGEVTILLYWTN